MSADDDDDDDDEDEFIVRGAKKQKSGGAIAEEAAARRSEISQDKRKTTALGCFEFTGHLPGGDLPDEPCGFVGGGDSSSRSSSGSSSDSLTSVDSSISYKNLRAEVRSGRDIRAI